MKNITIPIVPVDISGLDFGLQVGPNSQPMQEDEYGYLPLPTGMASFDLPYVRHCDDPVALVPAIEVLSTVRDTLKRRQFGCGENPAFDLSVLQPDALAVVNEAFGQGEVSAIVSGDLDIHIQETVFAGLWRVQALNDRKQVVCDLLEVGTIPRAVLAAVANELPAMAQADEAAPPELEGMMNARPVLFELLAAARARQPGDRPHVVNLSLLPMTPSDLSWLGDALGVGKVIILSRGYGNCRITAARWPWIWRVQYFNNDDKLILDMLEVTDVPEVALAAEDDMSDTLERLSEWIEILQQGLEPESADV